MKCISLFILLTALCFRSFPQSVYTYNMQKDLFLGTLAVGLSLVPFSAENAPEQIPALLDRNSVNGFDRALMFSYKKPLDIVSDNAPYGLALLPVISLIPNIKHANTLLTYGIMYSEAVLFTYGTAFSLKNSVIRCRPYVYTGGIPAGKEKDYYNSFPSGAASFIFLSASFLSTTFSHEFPESKWKLPVIIGSYTLAAGIGTMRILAGAHFLTDICAGAAIGSLYGWLIPRLHIKKDNEKYAIIPTGNGIRVSIRF